ncbi:MAG: tRNA pseudouridine(38-40) synthase TruA [Chloroflexota bacterium]|jgi:tRNA pseudouridine38-40 synthase
MRVGLVIEYDGTEFHGSQLQPNARTVQGEIENALHRIFEKDIRLYLASRTDSGVHARGQVARFDVDKDMEPDQVRKALNHYMDKDVRIRCAQLVQDGPDGFDPRGDASARTYFYSFNDAPSAPAIERRTVTHVRKSLQADRMNAAAATLIGSHDFKAFAGPSAPADASTRRVVESASVERDGDVVRFEITANAFLHQQIRRTAGVLYSVGVGDADVDRMEHLVTGGSRGEAAHVMPARGLNLEKISYNGSGECGLPAFATADTTNLGVN